MDSPLSDDFWSHLRFTRINPGMKRTILALPFALLTVTGCVEEEPILGEDTAGLGVFDGNGDPCPKLGCGSNSAHLGPAEFHELDETRTQANLEGFRITGFKKSGSTLDYKLDVTGTTLTGQLNWFGTWVTALSGQGLAGSTIYLVGPGGVKYSLLIAGVTSQTMWQAPLVQIETYQLRWKFTDYDFGWQDQPVCVDPPNRYEGEWQLWNSITEAILFTGDRYDTNALEIDSVGPSPWFNIACAGTVMAKLALNRHTSATQTSSFPTTLDQRQAMLKMYTSDVCHNGDALTVTGTKLRWASSNGLSSPAIPVNSLEAAWGKDGAICLSTHRLNGTADDMDSQIAASCNVQGLTRPPPCTFELMSGAYLITTSPALP